MARKTILENSYIIEAPGFEEHNEKSKGKGLNWFRVNVRMYGSQKYLRLSSTAKLLWHLILSEVASSSSRCALIHPNSIKRVVHGNQSGIQRALNELSSIQWIRIVRSPTNLLTNPLTNSCNGSKEPTCVLEDEDWNKEPQEPVVLKTNAANGTKPKTLRLDFDALYKIYPRKEGKKRGIEICKRQIKTQDDYNKLELAIKNYARIKKGSEFIKHFSTFMNEWSDWLDPDAGKILKRPQQEFYVSPDPLAFPDETMEL